MKLENNEFKYDAENRKLSINYHNSNQENNTARWSNANDIYKIGYRYSNQVDTQRKQITLKTILKTKLYTKEENKLVKEETMEINPLSNLASIEKQMTDFVYKGYLYANTARETEYQEEMTLEVSKLDGLSDIEISVLEDSFETVQGEIKNANTYFNEIILKKEQLKSILGDNFTVSVRKEDNTEIAAINKETKEDEEGKIHIQLGEDKGKNICVKMNTPVKEGNIDLLAKKVIKSQTGYSKQELETFSKLIAKTKMIGNEKEEQYQSEMQLKDTIVQNTIEVNEKNWSTLQTNQNIQIIGILNSNNEMHDLYKNPTITFQLPKEIENIEITSIQKLYADEMEIEYARLYPEDKRIEIKLNGEQTEFKNDIGKGLQIVINANIAMHKNQATKSVEIQMFSQNENRKDGVNETKASVQLNSNYGVLLYHSMQGYNNQNDKIESVSQDIKLGNLDVEGTQKEATVQANIVNNYEYDINKICLLGRLPNVEETDVLKSDVSTNLLNQVNVQGAKVYYATDFVEKDSDLWSENVKDLADVKMFKIEIEKMSPGENIPISYTVQIPENIGENKNAYESLNLSYLYGGQKAETYSTLKLISRKRTKCDK